MRNKQQQNGPRSSRMIKVFTLHMRAVVAELKSKPLVPFDYKEYADKNDLKRNDVINLRRNLMTIERADGPIRFIDTKGTVVVWLPDDIDSTEKLVDSLSAAAVYHICKKNQINLDVSRIEGVQQKIKEVQHAI